jgi:catechol 2,3-dioxygenase-like lactoylglutathione lyase family enzyme
MLGDAAVLPMLATTRPAEARRFFGETLGLTFETDDGFALVFGAGLGRLRIQKVEAFTPHAFTALGWMVDDIRFAIRELAKKGVVFERYEAMEQDADGVWTPPGTKIGVAWFKDPDGNLLSLTERG